MAAAAPARDFDRRAGADCSDLAGRAHASAAAGDPAAGTTSQRKCARALSERAKIRALPIEDFDAANMPIGVGVELDRRRRGAAGRRHLDDAGGAADTEGCLRRRDFHVAGLGNEAGDEGGGAGCHVE